MYSEIFKFFLKENLSDVLKKFFLMIAPGFLLFILFFVLGILYLFFASVVFFVIGITYLIFKLKKAGDILVSINQDFATLVNLTKTYKNMDFHDLIKTLKESNIGLAYSILINEIYNKLDTDVQVYLKNLQSFFKDFPHIQLYIQLLIQKFNNLDISKQIEYLSEIYVPYLYNIRKIESIINNVKLLVNIIPFFLVILFIIVYFSIKKIEVFINMPSFHKAVLSIGGVFLTVFGISIYSVPLVVERRKDKTLFTLMIYMIIISGVLLLLNLLFS